MANCRTTLALAATRNSSVGKAIDSRAAAATFAVAAAFGQSRFAESKSSQAESFTIANYILITTNYLYFSSYHPHYSPF